MCPEFCSFSPIVSLNIFVLVTVVWPHPRCKNLADAVEQRKQKNQ